MFVQVLLNVFHLELIFCCFISKSLQDIAISSSVHLLSVLWVPHRVPSGWPIRMAFNSQVPPGDPEDAGRTHSFVGYWVEGLVYLLTKVWRPSLLSGGPCCWLFIPSLQHGDWLGQYDQDEGGAAGKVTNFQKLSQHYHVSFILLVRSETESAHAQAIP